MVTPGVLVETVNITDESISAQWRDWYDRAQLTAFTGVPGVLAGRRGVGVVGSCGNIVVYDLADFLLPMTSAWQRAEAIASAAGPPSPAVRDAVAAGERRLYRQIFATVSQYRPPQNTTVLHGAFFESQPENHDEFNDWYNTEHVLFVDAIDGYLNCRRFQAVDDGTKFLALYDVTTMNVAMSDEVAQANSSPWSDRVRAKLVSYRERRLFELGSFQRGAA